MCECVCVCVCVCVCGGGRFIFFPIYIFVADNISISRYIMCVILCLFSALSRTVGALQISIIIVITSSSSQIALEFKSNQHGGKCELQNYRFLQRQYMILNMHTLYSM